MKAYLTSIRCTWVISFFFFSTTIWGMYPPESQVLLKKGTEVNLRLVETLHSSKVEVGNIVQLEVDIDVMGKGGLVAIRTGAYAIGIIKRVRKKGILGRRGELVVEAISVKGVDGSSIELEGRALIKKGRSRTGVATLMSLGVGVTTNLMLSSNRQQGSLSPEGAIGASIGLFVQGSSAEINLGEPLYAKVVEDIQINIIE